MLRIRIPLVLVALWCGAAASLPAQGQQPDTIRAALRYTRADVDFLSGMIAHHAQALAMCRMAPSHQAGPEVQRLCGRVINAQTDEITIMSRWLRNHNEAVPAPDPRGLAMPGMGPMLMPGMLTPEQMAQLDSARGVEWDRLFLRDMIQHHRGAVDMVNQLFGKGAGEEETVYKLAADIFADQTTEIERMQHMLANSLLGPPPGQ